MIYTSALDLSFLIRELKTLDKSIVEKIFHPSKNEILLQLHKSNEGKKLLKIVAGQGIHITKEKKESTKSEKPSNFCMFLRKKLKQSRLLNITQHELERILELNFSYDLKLIVELFSKGNIILCDHKNKIIFPLQTQEWKHRIIKRGNTYKYPPKTTNPFSLTEKEFTEIYKKSNKENVVKTLATEFSLGRKYAEEICLSAKVDKTKKKTNTSKIYKEIQNIKNRPLKPNLIYSKETGELLDISPIELNIYKEENKKYIKNFSEVLEEFFRTFSEDTIQETSEKQKLLNLAEKQKEQIKELERKAEDYKKIGDLIYAHFNEIDQIIKEIKKNNWNLKHPLIKEINKKECKLILEL